MNFVGFKIVWFIALHEECKSSPLIAVQLREVSTQYLNFNYLLEKFLEERKKNTWVSLCKMFNYDFEIPKIKLN